MSIYMFNNGVMKNRKWKSMNNFSISFCLSLYYKAFLDDERGSTKKKELQLNLAVQFRMSRNFYQLELLHKLAQMSPKVRIEMKLNSNSNQGG